MDPDHSAPPLNPLPWIVWVLALPMIAMEAVVTLGASGLVGGGRSGRLHQRHLEAFARQQQRQRLPHHAGAPDADIESPGAGRRGGGDRHGGILGAGHNLP